MSGDGAKRGTEQRRPAGHLLPKRYAAKFRTRVRGGSKYDSKNQDQEEFRPSQVTNLSMLAGGNAEEAVQGKQFLARLLRAKEA
jgi:hypothetical protein